MNLRAATDGRTPGEVLRIALIMIIFVASSVFLCGQFFDFDRGPSDMRIGERVLFQMMGERNLEQTDFFDTYPEARPSDWVEFIDSDAGEMLWPRTLGNSSTAPGDPESKTGPEGQYTIPRHLSLVPYEPVADKERQLVYIPDDENGQMLLEAYDAPDEEPVFEWTHDFPTDASKLKF